MASLLLLLVLACLVRTASTGSCKGRQRISVSENTTGFITDGESFYDAKMECEYLFDTPHTDAAIMLNFTSFATECQYDYFFVYDGSSYTSPMIGSFSGDDVVPEPVIAYSGKMLVLFYSDTNYVMLGFNATYSVVRCNSTCAHGQCDGARCLCDAGWAGDSCDTLACPSNCSGHGVCDLDNSRCRCEFGYTGADCSAELSRGVWSVMSTSDVVFKKRQLAASCQDDSQWFIYGGRSLVETFDDLLVFNFQTQAWTELVPLSQERPPPLYSATMTLYSNTTLLLYGGFNSELFTVSRHVWMYDLASSVWTELSASIQTVDVRCPRGYVPVNTTLCESIVAPSNMSSIVMNGSSFDLPELSSHSATLVDSSLVIIGGRSNVEEFHFYMYIFHLDSRVLSRMTQHRRMYTEVVGHSTIWHEPSRSIYVYGGSRPYHLRYAEARDLLYTYHYDQDRWSSIDKLPGATWPPPLMSHTALRVTDDIFVLFGGYHHIHHEEEVCHNWALFAFSFSCNKWSSAGGAIGGATRADVARGRAGHSGAVYQGGMYVAGGYHGRDVGDVSAYFPFSQWCESHATDANCLGFADCGSCLKQETPALASYIEHVDSTLAIASDRMNSTRVSQFVSLEKVPVSSVEDCARACINQPMCMSFEVTEAVTSVSCQLLAVSPECASYFGMELTNVSRDANVTLYAPVAKSMCAIQTLDDFFDAPQCAANSNLLAWDATSSSPRCMCDPGFEPSLSNSSICTPLCSNASCPLLEQCGAGNYLFSHNGKRVCVTAADCLLFGETAYMSSQGRVCGQALVQNTSSLVPINQTAASAAPPAPADNACFANTQDAQAYFGELVDSLATLGSSHAFVSSAQGSRFAYLATDGNVGQLSASMCAQTLSEVMPYWAVDLSFVFDISNVLLYGLSSACNEDMCAGAGAEVTVRVSNSTKDNFPGELCGVATLSSSGSVAVSCNTVARYVIVQPVETGMTQLALCEVVVLPADAGEQMTGQCGDQEHGAYTQRVCPSPCLLHDTCGTCAVNTGCTWCESTSQCLDVLNTSSVDICDQHLDTAAKCALLEPSLGVTREVYPSLGSASVAGVLSSFAFQNTIPDRVTFLSSFSSLENDLPGGVRVHGYVVPPETGNYKFAIRNSQGVETALRFYNTSGPLSSVTPLTIARENWSVRPQTRWDRAAGQLSAAMRLEGGVAYYLEAISFGFEERFYGNQTIDVAWINGSRTVVTDDDIIHGQYLRPYVQNCSSLSTCRGCMTSPTCSWCGSTCVTKAEAATCTQPVVEIEECPACSDFTDCPSCTATGVCQYYDFECGPVSTSSNPVRTPEQCPLSCESATNCSTCAALSQCGWCSTSNQCFAFSGYQLRFSAGKCLTWHTSAATCPACSTRSSCSSCLDNHECVWSYDADYPLNGTCVEGDFNGPASAAIAISNNWTYDTCPNIDECFVGADDCHKHALCTDVDGAYPTSFLCSCLPGYNGSGTTCAPVCHAGCGTGECVAPDTCDCPLVWTGPTCEQCDNIVNGTNVTHPCGSSAACVPSSEMADAAIFNYTSYMFNTSSNVSDTFECRCFDGYIGDPVAGCVPDCSTYGCIHGDCTAPNTCSCRSGFGGPACTECVVDEDYACSPFATCSRISTGTEWTDVCTCVEGYTGDGIHCEPVCTSACVRGTCVAPDVCACPPGFNGPLCQSCDADTPPCAANASCLLTSQGFSECMCDAGYEGDGLSTCTPICEDACVHGNCTAPNTCTCEAGFAGDICNQCNPEGATFCQGNSSCIFDDNIAQYSCICDEGFDPSESGRICEPSCPQGCVNGVCDAPDHCRCEQGWANSVFGNCTECVPSAVSLGEAASACDSNGFCNVSGFGEDAPFLCQCHNGYVGVGAATDETLSAFLQRTLGTPVYNGSLPDNEVPPGCVPICEQQCHHGGECVDVGTCSCPRAYGGADCTSCPDINECSEYASCGKLTLSEMSLLQSQRNVSGNASFHVGNETFYPELSYFCQCLPGYEGNGSVCEPICSLGCIHGTCTEPETCECDVGVGTELPGWQGVACDECIQGRHDCHANATCGSVNATLTCTCDQGFEGDGSDCTPRCDGGCVHGTCVFQAGPPWGTCVCDAGFEGSNCSTCIQGMHGCHSNATCASVLGQLECTCDGGYEGDGYDCAPVCTQTCGNGYCSAPDTCSCYTGFYGPQCEQDCLCNGNADCPLGAGVCGTCHNNTQGATCDTCVEGYYGNPPSGQACQPCPCNEHGRCDPVTGSCQCDASATGTQCGTCAAGFFGNPTRGVRCSPECTETRNRIVLTSASGFLTSGPSTTCNIAGIGITQCYSASQSCGITLVADSPNKTITLEIESFHTECDYDYLRVFDGLSLRDPMMAALSGKVQPTTLHSSPGVGALTLHWSSDSSWVLEGWSASYRVEDCPAACSGHGTCMNGVCSCHEGWQGLTCAIESCPNNCFSSEGQGVCSAALGRCLCQDGYIGQDCGALESQGGWVRTGGVALTPRASHASVYVPSNDTIVVYGGRRNVESHEFASPEDAPESYISDIVAIDALTWRTETLTSDQDTGYAPAGRYQHTMTLWQDRTLVVFGGRMADSVISNELWLFDLSTRLWTSRTAGQDAFWPLPRYAHCAVIDGDALYVFGGRGLTDGVEFDNLAYNIVSNTWRVLPARGAVPPGAFASAAVLHASSSRVFLYGGIGSVRMTNGLFNQAQYFAYTQLQERARLWAFDLTTETWAVMEDPKSLNVPTTRRWHSMALIDHYLVIYGGTTFTHTTLDPCFDHSAFVFDLTCEKWLPSSDPLVVRLAASLPSGRTNTAIVSRPPAITRDVMGTSLSSQQPSFHVIGGFNGSILADIHSFVLPVQCENVPVNECDSVPGCARCTCQGDSKICGCASSSSIVTSTECPPETMCAPQSCSVHTDCQACASADGCGWLYDQTGAFAGLLGSCVPVATGSQTALAIRDPSVCDECGIRSNCEACAGTQITGFPGAGGKNGTCGWYEVPPFRFHFCLSPSNPVMAISSVRKQPDLCPASCRSMDSCSRCHELAGCVWCDATHTCVEDSISVADYSLGQCLNHDTDATCPAACSKHSSCGDCIQDERCGWCSDGSDGGGTCTEGDAHGSYISGTCSVPDSYGIVQSRNYFTPSFDDGVNMTQRFPVSSVLPPWHFFACPDVNECETSTPCSPHAVCTNLDQAEFPGLPLATSYTCKCKEGYTGNGIDCTPVCDLHGCLSGRGTCVLPNVCECNIGFTGLDCSKDCNCNGHSDCGFPSSSGSVCSSCEHNTEGDRCQFCSPGFSGNATRGTPTDCRPCLAVCNTHSNECYQSVEDAPDGAVCKNCDPESHSFGPFCEFCEQGYYRTVNSQGFVSCTKCVCNGHGSMCNPLNGSNCVCDPDSFTTTSDAAKPCSSCMPGYLPAGTSLGFGERCYKLVSVGATTAVSLMQSDDYSSFNGVFPAATYVPGEGQRDLQLSFSARSGTFRVLVSSKPTSSLETCSTAKCLQVLCRASGCVVESSATRTRAVGGESPHVIVPCNVFDMFTERIYVTVIPLEPRVSFSLKASADSTSSNPFCAKCVGASCSVPCSPGYFRHPSIAYLCTPCECNGHGDRCNVLDGSECGMASDGCDYLTGRNCKCAHNTESVPLRSNALPHEEQCNRCLSSGTSDGSTIFNGSPSNGRQCYRTVSSQETKAQALASTDVGVFYVFKPDRYTNVDLRITVDVWSGDVELQISLDDDAQYLLNTALYTGPQVSASTMSLKLARLASRKQTFVIPHSEHTFADPQFRVYVGAVARSSTAEFTIYSEQNLSRIDLVVFFQVFFASFYLLLAFGTVAHKVRVSFRHRRELQEQVVQLEEMSRRPRACVNIVLRDDIPQDVFDQLMLRPLPMPKALLTWSEPSPIAIQPLAGRHEGNTIATFVVEMPGARTASLQLGVAHLGARVRRSGKRRSRKKNTQIVVSAV